MHLRRYLYSSLACVSQSMITESRCLIIKNVLGFAVAHGPLTRYVKLQVAHAPGMPGTFSPAADFKGNRKLAIPTCITARAWRTCRDACRDCAPAVTGKTFPAFPAHARLQFCVSGKRPMELFPGTMIWHFLWRRVYVTHNSDGRKRSENWNTHCTARRSVTGYFWRLGGCVI